MPNLMDLLKTTPAYIIATFEKHMIAACIAAVVFVFVLFFSNKIAAFFRKLFVIAVLLLGVYAYFKDKWNLLVLAVGTLLVLLVIRLIGYTITTIRTNRRNKRIEERALERAAKRRGSWSNKQGYSGARKMIVEPEYVPEEMNREEIEEVIRNELSDKKPEDLEDVTFDDISETITEDLTDTTADIVSDTDTIDSAEAVTEELSDTASDNKKTE